MGFTMLCDVISAVAEFMVRVLHSRLLLGFKIFLELTPGNTCDVISAVAEFMVAVAWIEARQCM